MATPHKLEFENLPLVEAAVRASFNVSKPLTYSLINAIAAELRQSFPTIEVPNQLELAPGIEDAQLAIGTAFLPGAVYAGNETNLSVSVQPQVVVARWVRYPGLENPRYPHFGPLRDALWRAVEAFQKSSGDEFPGIAVVNMSYVNFVESDDPGDFVNAYFSDAAQLQLMAGAKQIRKLEAAWSELEDLDMRFAIEQASAKFPDSVKSGFRLTTAAGLRIGESLNAKDGLEEVHASLQTFFLKLISKRAKKEWKLKEPA